MSWQVFSRHVAVHQHVGTTLWQYFVYCCLFPPFLVRGLIEAVLLGIFRACPIYISAALDMQGDRAKSNPLLVRCGLGCGWRLVGREWPRLVRGWFPSVTVLTVLATQSNSSKPHGPKRSRWEPPVQLPPCCSAIFCPHTGFVSKVQCDI